MGPLWRLNDQSPEIDPSAWAAPTAVLVGRVRLLAQANVWFGAVLRGDNEWIEIGAGSNVQDGAVVHTDPGMPATIAEDVTIGHNAVIHGCRIGPGALIGMGATVMNGAEIGAECLVGANALVTEGQIFEPGTLILGAPAKAARALVAEARAGLRESAKRYVANAARFRDGLAPISG